MVKKLAAALIAISLPGTASAWEWGTASAGNLDLYYAPAVTDEAGAEDRGDGHGLRGTFKVWNRVAAVVEYGAHSFDSRADLEQARAGLGWTLESGSGLFVEYVQENPDSGRTLEGPGVRGRLMAQAMPDVQVYADLGYAQLKAGAREPDEMFYAVGGTFAVSRQWGFFADYRMASYDEEGVSPDRELSLARLGVNIRLDY